jgi:hypothetical protein
MGRRVRRKIFYDGVENLSGNHKENRRKLLYSASVVWFTV